MERILELPRAPDEQRVRVRLAGQRYRRFSPTRLLRGSPADALRGVERVLVPYWLVHLDVTTARRRGATRTSLFVDAVSGECRALPDGATVTERASGSAASVEGQLSRADAMRLATHGVRWQVLRAGNVHLRGLELAPGDAEQVYLPTWLGYFTDAAGHIRVRCVNGVDGGLESAVYAMKLLRGLPRPPSPDVAGI